MPVTTLRHIIDDIVLDLNQTFDDAEIKRTQIAYWVTMIANRLKSQHIGKRDSGAFLSTFAGIPVETFNSIDNPNKIPGRKYIELPKTIYDYDMDGGIEFIAYYEQEEDCEEDRPLFTRVQFTRTSQAESRRLYYSKYEEPSPKNPYFYRVHEYIYLLGIECSPVKEVEIGIYTAFDPITTIDVDAPFEFPEELIAILKRQVLDLGRFALLIPKERINDGEGDLSNNEVPTQKLTSVNELREEQTNNE